MFPGNSATGKVRTWEGAKDNWFRRLPWFTIFLPLELVILTAEQICSLTSIYIYKDSVHDNQDDQMTGSLWDVLSTSWSLPSLQLQQGEWATMANGAAGREWRVDRKEISWPLLLAYSLRRTGGCCHWATMANQEWPRDLNCKQFSACCASS